jgi:hypothetical protein
MRQWAWQCGILCGVLLGGAATPLVHAQRSIGALQQNIGANQSIVAAILTPVTEAPYQAQKLTLSVQKLSDGTVITHETKGLIARDAQGRMREDLYAVRSGQVEGHEQDMSLQSATVGDPVAHTVLFWTDETSKIAMQLQLPSLPGIRAKGSPGGGVMGGIMSAPPPPSSGGARKTVSLENAPSLTAHGDKDDVRVEELGQQAIEGVLVTGRRTTTTIATGNVGNDRPIVVVHEEWRSPELKILVKTLDSDPRSGEQTMELQGLSRGDPEPSLFHAPDGYQIKDMAEMMKGLANLGKPTAP